MAVVDYGCSWFSSWAKVCRLAYFFQSDYQSYRWSWKSLVLSKFSIEFCQSIVIKDFITILPITSLVLIGNRDYPYSRYKLVRFTDIFLWCYSIYCLIVLAAVHLEWPSAAKGRIYNRRHSAQSAKLKAARWTFWVNIKVRRFWPLLCEVVFVKELVDKNDFFRVIPKNVKTE